VDRQQLPPPLVTVVVVEAVRVVTAGTERMLALEEPAAMVLHLRLLVPQYQEQVAEVGLPTQQAQPVQALMEAATVATRA
jgi:hypothetical protein